MHVRFSLVLVDDQAPTLRRPLSPFSTSVLALQQHMASTIDQAVASTVGPNRFVVAISDTPHSWLAFQVSFCAHVLRTYEGTRVQVTANCCAQHDDLSLRADL
jgi:hypothetical protein